MIHIQAYHGVKGCDHLRESPYNREKAVEYAHTWAFSRNPAYYNFDPIGGDCTNFASQAIFAGSGIMNYTPVMGWYYKSLSARTPSWSGVEFLHAFLVTNQKAGPYAQETDISQVQPGDIVQISFGENIFHHSPVIVSVGDAPSTGNILIAAHTYDSDNRPLDTYQYEKLRFIHIQGVRKW